ncbi:hypothetical protein D3C73_1039920 [compost metagenome]
MASVTAMAAVAGQLQQALGLGRVAPVGHVALGLGLVGHGLGVGLRGRDRRLLGERACDTQEKGQAVTPVHGASPENE